MKYSMSEIIGIIKSCEIKIPIEEFFDITGKNITKKEYGKVLIKYLCEELIEYDKD